MSLREQREAAVLLALRAAPKGLTLRELGERTGIDHTTLHGRLTVLERCGSIVRSARADYHPQDKQGRFLYEFRGATLPSKSRNGRGMIDPWRERR